MRTSFRSVDEIAAESERAYSPKLRNAQVTAWIVLSAAFAAFCALVIGASALGKQYYDTATVPMGGVLSIDSGIVLFRDSVTSTLINASNNLQLREGDEVLVGQGASASVSLFDGTRIQLYSSSDLALNEVRQSRFHIGFTDVGVTVRKGTARIEVAKSQAENQSFAVTTPHGFALLAPGNYGIEVDDNQSRISVRDGVASASGKGSATPLNAGQKALLTDDGMSAALPEGDALVRNGDFSQGFSQWNPLDINEAGRPEEPGQRSLVGEKIGGRDAMTLRISRLSPRATHNETGLTQVINKDVSDYLSLKLHASVKVTGQSLSGGGYMGYEYPVMIRVRYRDATGGQIDWTHGFFVSNPENRPTPNGEPVPRGEWITYDGELMGISPRPVHIISVEVLGAGHTFDGSVANVDLVGK